MKRISLKHTMSMVSLLLFMVFSILFFYQNHVTAYADDNDITDRVGIQLKQFYRTSDNQYIIKDGKLTSDASSIILKKGDDLKIKYEFSISPEHVENGYVSNGKYFKIDLPVDGGYFYPEFMPSTTIEITKLDGGGSIPFATAKLSGDVILVTLDQKQENYTGFDAVMKGFVEMEVKTKNVEGNGTIKVPHFDVENISLNFEKPPEVGPDPNFPPYDNPPAMSKFGSKNGDSVEWKIHLNRDAAKYLFKKGNSISEKKDYIVIDELPDELELDFNSLHIFAPLFAPAIDTNGNLLKDGTITEKINSKARVDLFYNTNANNGKFHLSKEDNDTWESFSQKIKASPLKPIIGIWKNKKIIINFGTLPNSEVKYSDISIPNSSYPNMKIDDLIDLLYENPNQIKAMKDFYSNAGIVSYTIVFRTKIVKAPVNNIVTNKLSVFYNGVKQEINSNPIRIAGIKGGAEGPKFKGTIEVIKEWRGNNGIPPVNSIKVVLLANGVKKEEIELNAGNNWRHSWTGLPIKDDNHKSIQYEVKEVSFVSGYRTEIIGGLDSATGKGTFSIINTKNPPPDVPPNTPPNIPPNTPPNIPPNTPPNIPPNTPPNIPPNTPPNTPLNIPPEIKEDEVPLSFESEEEPEDDEELTLDEDVPKVSKEVPKTFDYRTFIGQTAIVLVSLVFIAGVTLFDKFRKK